MQELLLSHLDSTISSDIFSTNRKLLHFLWRASLSSKYHLLLWLNKSGSFVMTRKMPNYGVPLNCLHQDKMRMDWCKNWKSWPELYVLFRESIISLLIYRSKIQRHILVLWWLIKSKDIKMILSSCLKVWSSLENLSFKTVSSELDKASRPKRSSWRQVHDQHNISILEMSGQTLFVWEEPHQESTTLSGS